MTKLNNYGKDPHNYADRPELRSGKIWRNGYEAGEEAWDYVRPESRLKVNHVEDPYKRKYAIGISTYGNFEHISVPVNEFNKKYNEVVKRYLAYDFADVEEKDDEQVLKVNRYILTGSKEN